MGFTGKGPWRRSAVLAAALPLVLAQGAAAWAQEPAVEEPAVEELAVEAPGAGAAGAEGAAGSAASGGAAAGQGAFGGFLLPAGIGLGLGLGLGGALAAVATGLGGGDDGAPRWDRQAAARPYDRRVAARYLPGGVHHGELMALSELRSDGATGFNPYLLVDAPTAYGHGATGRGQVIAILDDGYQLDHPELAGQLAGVYQRAGMPARIHGTHVASLAAGARNGAGMFGLAFGARLHLASLTDREGALGFTPTQWANATEAARAAGAVAQNNSWGIEGQGDERVRSADVARVVADPAAIDGLAADVRADLQSYLTDNAIDPESLRGNRLRTLTVFNQALNLVPGSGATTPVDGWGEADWRRYRRALQDFQQNGVVVWALSNHAPLDFADFNAALPSIFPELEGAWIAVANIDFTLRDPADPGGSALRARRMSAPCAQAAAYCLSHDGTEVRGAVPGGGYMSLTGTSLATPQVSAAVALLAEAFPDHTPRQLTARLLATAENFGGWSDLRRRADGSVVGRIAGRRVVLEEGPGELGETSFGQGVVHAHSSIYGHGFMDLGAAMQPIGGPPRLAVGGNLASASHHDLEASRIRLGPAFGDGLARGLAGASVMAFDRLGGGFETSLYGLVETAPAGPRAGELLATFARPSDLRTIPLNGGGRLEIALRPRAGARLSPTRGEGVQVDPELHLALPLAEGFGLTAWSSRSAARSFGLRASGAIEEELLLGRDAFANPFLAASAQGHGATLELGPAEGAGLRLGFFEGRHRDSAARHAEEREQDRVWGAAAELRLPFGEGGRLGALGLTGGLLSESGTLLGAETDGAFATEGGTQTYFTGISARLALDDLGLRGVSLVGSADWGWTRPRAASDSLFRGVSTIATESYSLGLQGEALFDPRDRFALTVTQPLRVRGGSATLDLPVGRTGGLDLRHERVRVGLAPSGREVSLGASYGLRLDESTDLAGALLYRRQPGHRRDAGGEGIGLVKLRMSF